MAFPSVVSYITNIESSDVTSHYIDMPMTYSVNDALFVFFGCDDPFVNITIGSGTGWVLYDLYDGTAATGVIAVKIADGSDTLRLDTDSAQQSTSIVYAITGQYGGFSVEKTMSTSANANPPACIPPLTRRDYLWIVYAIINETNVASAAPSGFANLITQVAATTNGVSSSSAQINYATGASYDPGSFTSPNAAWIAYTVCIAPPAPLGIGLNNIAYYDII